MWDQEQQEKEDEGGHVGSQFTLSAAPAGLSTLGKLPACLPS
jgi:hypothetical protein